MQSTSPIKQQLVVAYDVDAGRRSKVSDRNGWKAEVRQNFVNRLKNESKKSILELGAGAGVDARFFARQDFDVLATDMSPGMVKACQESGIRAKVLDLYDITSLGQQFDAVYSMNVLLHVPPEDLDQVLVGIRDALEDNGLFYYGVYGGPTKQETITDPSRVDLPRYFSFLSDADLKNIVQRYFEIVDFAAIDIGNDQSGLHFQSLLLRKS